MDKETLLQKEDSVITILEDVQKRLLKLREETLESLNNIEKVLQETVEFIADIKENGY